jgi:hypothetical protein
MKVLSRSGGRARNVVEADVADRIEHHDEWRLERLPRSPANFSGKMTNAANFFAAFEACLPAAYEVSCRIRTGSPTSFWLDSPRTVASRRSIGSPVPRRRGLGRQAATRRRHGGVYEFARGCQSSTALPRLRPAPGHHRTPRFQFIRDSFEDDAGGDLDS